MAMSDDELERRAVEELLKEANRGRIRAETMGPAGWMRCPLGSTNKRFLLNTLRPCAAERRSGSRSAMSRGTEDHREEGHRRSHHHPKEREHSYGKDTKPRREPPHSHSQTSKPFDSSTNESSSIGCTLYQDNQSDRSHSRSPIRERMATKRSTDRTPK